MCKKLLGENVAVLEQTIQLLDPRQVSRAVDLLRRSRRVVCMGQGSSMVLSEEAWTLFSTVSPKFLFVPDSHLQMNTLALMDPDELVLFFSYSGSTRDFQDLLEVARQRQVKVVLVSRFPKIAGGPVGGCGAPVRRRRGAAPGRLRQCPDGPALCAGRAVPGVLHAGP